MEKVTLAFAVKWIRAWAIMHGYKTAEYRAAPPVVRKGRCSEGGSCRPPMRRR